MSPTCLAHSSQAPLLHTPDVSFGLSTSVTQASRSDLLKARGRRQIVTNLLESSLTVLALIPDPSVVAHASPVEALPRKTVFIARLGHGGGFRVKHELEHHEQPQAGPPDVPGAPLGRPGPGAEMPPPDILHDECLQKRLQPGARERTVTARAAYL